MLVGLGIDVVGVPRVERELARDAESFCRQVFTAHESDACRRSRRPARAFARCFAAKEAVAKALGLDGSLGLPWRSIEISFRGNDAAVVTLTGPLLSLAERRRIHRLHVALAATRRHAAAAALIEGVQTSQSFEVEP